MLPASEPSSRRFSHQPDFPRRIVCLTGETTETLYLIGEEDRIVGVSGFTTRPPKARNKPRVSAFRDADVDAILALKPDLVLAFSDVQAEITRQLVLRGVAVLNFNQRHIAGIFDMISVLSRLVAKETRGSELIQKLCCDLDAIAKSAESFPRRPRVFFEEWNDPLISGIGWVEELIEIAGGNPIFPELRSCGKSMDRVVDPGIVVTRDPDIIIASWCGMKVNRQQILSRPDWARIKAIRNGQIYEISSGLILQPGPAALTEGVRQLHAILAGAVGVQLTEDLRPAEMTEARLL
jgi:iron complex transport system substrate-binding protein